MDDSKYTESSVDNEETNLFKLAAAGDEDARAKIIIDNLPLVNYFVKNYINCGVPYDDLFQEGTYGLILAVNRYDPSRNTKFATFAYNYISKYIKKALIEQQTSSLLNYKESFYYDMRAYINAGDVFEAENGRRPTDEEISKLLKFSPLQLQRMKTFVESCLTYVQRTDPVTIGKYSSMSAEDEVMGNLDIKELNANLTDREEEVIRRRLGFTSSGIPEGWAKMSAEMGFSVNTLRAAFSTGLKKIERILNK